MAEYTMTSFRGMNWVIDSSLHDNAGNHCVFAFDCDFSSGVLRAGPKPKLLYAGGNLINSSKKKLWNVFIEDSLYFYSSEGAAKYSSGADKYYFYLEPGSSDLFIGVPHDAIGLMSLKVSAPFESNAIYKHFLHGVDRPVYLTNPGTSSGFDYIWNIRDLVLYKCVNYSFYGYVFQSGVSVLDNIPDVFSETVPPVVATTNYSGGFRDIFYDKTKVTVSAISDFTVTLDMFRGVTQNLSSTAYVYADPAYQLSRDASLVFNSGYILLSQGLSYGVANIGDAGVKFYTEFPGFGFRVLSGSKFDSGVSVGFDFSSSSVSGHYSPRTRYGFSVGGSEALYIGYNSIRPICDIVSATKNLECAFFMYAPNCTSTGFDLLTYCTRFGVAGRVSLTSRTSGDTASKTISFASPFFFYRDPFWVVGDPAHDVFLTNPFEWAPVSEYTYYGDDVAGYRIPYDTVFRVIFSYYPGSAAVNDDAKVRCFLYLYSPRHNKYVLVEMQSHDSHNGVAYSDYYDAGGVSELEVSFPCQSSSAPLVRQYFDAHNAYYGSFVGDNWLTNFYFNVPGVHSARPDNDTVIHDMPFGLNIGDLRVWDSYNHVYFGKTESLTVGMPVSGDSPSYTEINMYPSLDFSGFDGAVPANTCTSYYPVYGGVKVLPVGLFSGGEPASSFTESVGVIYLKSGSYWLLESFSSDFYHHNIRSFDSTVLYGGIWVDSFGVTQSYSLPPSFDFISEDIYIGCLFGVKGSTLYWSEPYQFSRWVPGLFSYTFSSNIIGCCSFQNSFYVFTDDGVFFTSGTSVESLIFQKIVDFRLLSRYAFCKTRTMIYFMTNQGLFSLSPGGVQSLVSDFLPDYVFQDLSLGHVSVFGRYLYFSLGGWNLYRFDLNTNALCIVSLNSESGVARSISRLIMTHDDIQALTFTSWFTFQEYPAHVGRYSLIKESDMDTFSVLFSGQNFNFPRYFSASEMDVSGVGSPYIFGFGSNAYLPYLAFPLQYPVDFNKTHVMTFDTSISNVWNDPTTDAGQAILFEKMFLASGTIFSWVSQQIHDPISAGYYFTSTAPFKYPVSGDAYLASISFGYVGTESVSTYYHDDYKLDIPADISPYSSLGIFNSSWQISSFQNLSCNILYVVNTTESDPLNPDINYTEDFITTFDDPDAWYAKIVFVDGVGFLQLYTEVFPVTSVVCCLHPVLRIPVFLRYCYNDYKIEPVCAAMPSFTCTSPVSSLFAYKPPFNASGALGDGWCYIRPPQSSVQLDLSKDYSSYVGFPFNKAVNEFVLGVHSGKIIRSIKFTGEE